jgi:hypothetical protein
VYPANYQLVPCCREVRIRFLSGLPQRADEHHLSQNTFTAYQLRADDLVQSLDHLLQFLKRNAPEFLPEPVMGERQEFRGVGEFWFACTIVISF